MFQPLTPPMGFSTRFSLKQEYDAFVEREVEDYKERLPRSAILKIADEAVLRLHEQEQVALNEILLCDEVDRIITARLRIPSFGTWSRKRRKELATLRRPEAWGLSASDPLVRNCPTMTGAHVLVSQPLHQTAALFLAANGCTVSALEQEEDSVVAVMEMAMQHGLATRVQPWVGSLDGWSPGEPLSAVICSPAAFAGLSEAERARVLAVLQSATRDGGVHLVETLIAGQQLMDVAELERSYAGWTISVESEDGGRGQTFVARKVA
jgi:hypothetical protein